MEVAHDTLRGAHAHAYRLQMASHAGRPSTESVGAHTRFPHPAFVLRVQADRVREFHSTAPSDRQYIDHLTLASEFATSILDTFDQQHQIYNTNLSKNKSRAYEP